ncbi:MAG: ATP phosphoribosyltransferase regulatory subunit [Campylobacterota bacterium]|nr:ATP phosphoribosyltransferase regulatory subunit [Campylobacterota bacterium]
MIFEHEIPNGSKLYFGNSAKNKRELENKASEFLVNAGFEEIVTPNFSYSQHQSIDDINQLITLSDEQNNALSLRADSTLDVVRIITKRLGRATEHKKWFYIQPVFTYPANETYQIGAEWIGYDNISDIINLNCDLLEKFSIKSLVQIANINIPLLICKELNIDIKIFKDGDIDKLFDLKIDWLSKLISIETKEELEDIIEILPKFLHNECKKLIDIVSKVNYVRVTISPIYYDALKYYDDIYYRVLNENITLAKGGGYKSEGVNSLGFALYTDSLLKSLEG